MTAAVAVFPDKPDSNHIPDGRGVLVEVDKEIGVARYDAIPEGYEVESPGRVGREAVETRAVRRERSLDGRIEVREESIRDGYLCGSW